MAENPYRAVLNFNAGELSPLLYSREELAKFQSGLSLMENAIPIPQGGAEKRPGTKFIAEVKTSSLKTRLLPFEFSTSQSYIIEAGNQYMRFYTDSAPITDYTGSEDLSALDNVVAHWKLNETTGTTIDNDEGTAALDGTSTTDAANITTAGNVGTCFDLGGEYCVHVGDDAALSFGNSTVDSAFSVAAWAYITSYSAVTPIFSKWTIGSDREYALLIHTDGTLRLQLYDESANVTVVRHSDDAIAIGWHFFVATYAGQSTSGATAANFITLYVDGTEIDSTAINQATYDAMEAGATNVSMGSLYSGANPSTFWPDKIDNVALFGDVLTSNEVAALVTLGIYEISTPYLTADLFELKYEQSADVLYISHPDYETRKLSRLANNDWSVEVIDVQTGPFRTQNSTVAKTITADGTTGSVTLTASGHAPFNANTTKGHIPSGSTATSKSQTGALFKLVHPLSDLEFKDTLEDDYAADQTEGVSWHSCGTLYKDTEWTWTTDGTWLGTVEVQRNYTIGAAHGAAGWETVLPFSGVTTARNVSTSGTEEAGDADYRVIFTDDTSGTVISYFTTNQLEHAGIVEITAVASPTSATGTVRTTLASTDATYKWSEGSWSNYRGWPQTSSFFEDRLMFGGNTSQPDTIWGSVTSDYENMLAGVDDDSAVIFTLSSRQVNVIEWLIGKDKLLIGTSGAEWTIAGGTDEPLTPSNVIAKQHSTYGSANLQANLANESVLFFQRGAEKMRELAYNWELDSYVAPDMTILADTVTNTGITDTAFQRTPNSILWTTRTDGELPIFSYERAENITAWSRMITQTNLAGTLTDSDIESVAVINGSPEDEVWVIVERTIGGSTVRYVEQFQQRDFGDAEDAFFVDAGVTYDSTASSAMTGLDHLDGQTVHVLADGVEFDTEVVAGGAITLSLNDVTTTASTVQMGLAYEVQLRTMPLSWAGGQTIQGRQKKISEVVSQWHKSGNFSIGKDATKLQAYSITNQTTDIDRKTFPPGYDRNGQVFVYQKSPEPLTLLSIMIEFQVQ